MHWVLLLPRGVLKTGSYPRVMTWNIRTMIPMVIPLRSMRRSLSPNCKIPNTVHIECICYCLIFLTLRPHFFKCIYRPDMKKASAKIGRTVRKVKLLRNLQVWELPLLDRKHRYRRTHERSEPTQTQPASCWASLILHAWISLLLNKLL